MNVSLTYGGGWKLLHEMKGCLVIVALIGFGVLALLCEIVAELRTIRKAVARQVQTANPPSPATED